MSTSDRQILLVDDLRVFLELERSILERAGYSVETASSGREALEKARLRKPELVLLDLYMPDLDGAECCRLIKMDPILRDVRVVIITSKAISSDRKRCLDAGCDGFVSKLAPHSQILVEIERAIRQRGNCSSALSATFELSYSRPVGPKRSAIGIDLGIEGVFVASKEPMERRTMLVLEIDLPGFERRLRLNGEVIGSAGPAANTDSVPGFHVRFRNVDPATSQMISEYLEEQKEEGPWRAV